MTLSTLVSRSLFALIAALILNAKLTGTEEVPAIGVALRIWSDAYVYDPEGTGGGSVELSVDGVLSPYNPSASPVVPPSEVLAWTQAGAQSPGTVTARLGDSNNGIIYVEPGRSYSLVIGGGNYQEGNVTFAAPSGFRVLLDGEYRTKASFSGASTFVFELVDTGMRRSQRAGVASAGSPNELEWTMSLGSLKNGQSAGELSLLDPGTAFRLESAFHSVATLL